jgi:NAD-dependent SIR2 family protein deacetylase
MEEAGRLSSVVTQNVDGLHQAAGTREVIDLHGRADRVICTSCGTTISRAEMQREMERLNGPVADAGVTIAPDSDAELPREATDTFVVPACATCGGVLKPDVVFFGDSVPKTRVQDAFDALHRSDAMLVIGSSLAVWSGYRFAVAAGKAGIPIAAITQGWTRADELIALKVEARCGEVLPLIASSLER